MKGIIFYLLIHSSDGHKGHGRANPTSVALKFMQASHVSGRGPNIYTIFCLQEPGCVEHELVLTFGG